MKQLFESVGSNRKVLHGIGRVARWIKHLLLLHKHEDQNRKQGIHKKQTNKQ